MSFAGNDRGDTSNRNEAILAAGARREVRAGGPLACRLRHKEVCGRQGPVPYAGELVLENRSSVTVEIAYTMTPLQFLNLEVIGPGGTLVSEGHFSDRFSPTLEPVTLRLLPGETFAAPVPLLSMVPREKRLPGVYQVRAVYDYGNDRVISDPVEVTVK
jgi:hypothetical protein